MDGIWMSFWGAQDQSADARGVPHSIRRGPRRCALDRTVGMLPCKAWAHICQLLPNRSNLRDALVPHSRLAWKTTSCVCWSRRSA